MSKYTPDEGSPLDLLELEYAKLDTMQIIGLQEQFPDVMRDVHIILDVLMREGVEDANGYPVEKVLKKFHSATSAILVAA